MNNKDELDQSTLLNKLLHTFGFLVLLKQQLDSTDSAGPLSKENVEVGNSIFSATR